MGGYPRRPLGAASRLALGRAAAVSRSPSSRRSHEPRTSAPTAGTAVQTTNMKPQQRRDELDVGQAVLDHAAAQLVGDGCEPQPSGSSDVGVRHQRVAVVTQVRRRRRSGACRGPRGRRRWTPNTVRHATQRVRARGCENAPSCDDTDLELGLHAADRVAPPTDRRWRPLQGPGERAGGGRRVGGASAVSSRVVDDRSTWLVGPLGQPPDPVAHVEHRERPRTARISPIVP